MRYRGCSQDSGERSSLAKRIGERAVRFADYLLFFYRPPVDKGEAPSDAIFRGRVKYLTQEGLDRRTALALGK